MLWRGGLQAKWVAVVGALALAAALSLQRWPGAAGPGRRGPAAGNGWRLLAARTPQPVPERLYGLRQPLARLTPAQGDALVTRGLSAVRRLRVDGLRGPLAVERSPLADEPAERRWRMVLPCCAPADAPMVEAALGALLKLPAQGPLQVGVRPDDLERYGLLNPEARIELDLESPAGAASAPAGQAVAILVGARQPAASGAGELCYIKLDSRPAVYAVPCDGVEPLLWAMPGLWRRRQVAGLAQHELSRLNVFMPGRPGPVTLRKGGSGWRLGPSGSGVPADGAEGFVRAIWALEGHLVEPQAQGLEALRRRGTFGEVALEMLVPGYGGRPPTRLVVEAVPSAARAAPPAAPSIPRTEEGWGGEVEPWFSAGRPPLRRVYVEQGADRLLYAVSSVALRELEATAAQWTASPPGEPHR